MVYILLPLKSQFRTSSRKLSMKYVGPVVLYKTFDSKTFLLCTLDYKLLIGLYEHEKLRPAVIQTSQGNLSNLPRLKQVLHVGIKLN